MEAHASALPSDWREWSPGAKQALRDRLREMVRGSWRDQARPDQLPPDEDWTTLLLRGGRGSGKTWSGAHILCELIDQDPLRETEGAGAWAVVAPTFAEARDKCIEGESGLLAALGTTRAEIEARRSPTVRTWNRSIGELITHDGTRVLIDGADDGATSIQGENLRGAWCDEVGLWKKWDLAWDESIGYAVRKGQARIVATGTPKRIMPARKLIKRLLNDPQVVSRRLRTADNLHNLSRAFIDRNVTRHQGTELGRQELEGELLEDVAGALWQRSWFERDNFRAAGAPYGGWQRPPRVGVDPSDGTEDGAEHAYTVVGLGQDHKLYVVENDGLRVTPYAFAAQVLDVARRNGAIITVEKNHGGQWLVEVFERAMRDKGIRVPLDVVSAAEGKRTRAEPVAALYEQGHFRHIGVFEELEDQQTGWTGSPGEVSPDRLDSLVWAASAFTGLTFGPPARDQGAVPYVEAGKRTDTDVVAGAVAWR